MEVKKKTPVISDEEEEEEGKEGKNETQVTSDEMKMKVKNKTQVTSDDEEEEEGKNETQVTSNFHTWMMSRHYPLWAEEEK